MSAIQFRGVGGITASEVSERLARQMDGVVEYLLPNGKREGREWVVGSVNGEVGKSLKVVLSGERAGTWKDWATGEGGDALDLVAATRGVPIAEALKEARNYLGIADSPMRAEPARREYRRPERPKATRPKGKVLEYLHGRGLTDDALSAYKVAANDADDEIIFPYLRGGELVNCKYLKLERPDGKKVMRQERDAEPCLFGWQAIPDTATTIVLAEGEIDAMTWWQMGFPALSAWSGAGNVQWVENELQRLARFDSIYIAFDDDEAGRKGAQAVVELLGSARCRIVTTPFKDANECLAQGLDRAAFREFVDNAKAPPATVVTKSFGSNGSKPSWPEPKPIQAPLRPVPAFDANTLLPELLREWVMDEADRMPCAPDFVAVGAVVALGSVIGARCAIKPKAKDDWLVVPNLWGGIVAPPAAKKSPAKDAALKPLDRLVARAREAHTTELEGFETERLVYEARTVALEDRIRGAAKDPKKGNPEAIALELQQHRRNAPPAPTLRRFTAMDTTVEKLGELLRENPSGLLVQRDELVGLLASWDREGREGERSFFLEAWNGNGRFETDRIGRGSIVIPNLCVSIFGGIQPDKLTGYLEQAAHALANDGLLQRFQVLVYPDQGRWDYRDRIPKKDARDRAFKVFETLADADFVEWGAAPADDFTKLPHFRFEPEAQNTYIEWTSELNGVRLPAEGEPIIAQHLAKYDKLFPALALILHLVECAANGRKGPVTPVAAIRAAAWCEYLETHARRCYGLLMDDGLRAAQALAEKVRAGGLEDGFTARDVRRNQWRYLTTEEAVQAALDWLEDEGWLRGRNDEHQPGRPTRRYSINPRLKRDTDGDGDGKLA